MKGFVSVFTLILLMSFNLSFSGEDPVNGTALSGCNNIAIAEGGDLIPCASQINHAKFWLSTVECSTCASKTGGGDLTGECTSGGDGED